MHAPTHDRRPAQHARQRPRARPRRATHGHGDGPGIQIASPGHGERRGRRRREAGSSSLGSRRADWSGSRCTAGRVVARPSSACGGRARCVTGASEILLPARRSPSRRTGRAAPTCSGPRVRFRNTAGDRAFCQTPRGPIRRYGSPWYPSTTTSCARVVAQLDAGAEVDGADVQPGRRRRDAVDRRSRSSSAAARRRRAPTPGAAVATTKHERPRPRRPRRARSARRVMRCRPRAPARSRSARRVRDPRADRADGGVADLGGLGVRAPDHLGQHERGSRRSSSRPATRWSRPTRAVGVGADPSPSARRRAGPAAGGAGARGARRRRTRAGRSRAARSARSTRPGIRAATGRRGGRRPGSRRRPRRDRRGARRAARRRAGPAGSRRPARRGRRPGPRAGARGELVHGRPTLLAPVTERASTSAGAEAFRNRTRRTTTSPWTVIVAAPRSPPRLDGEDPGAARRRGRAATSRAAPAAAAFATGAARAAPDAPGHPGANRCRTSPTRSSPRSSTNPTPMARRRPHPLPPDLPRDHRVRSSSAWRSPPSCSATTPACPTHVARHLGSFALALGVGLLVVAWKPERAAGVLPVVAALVACLVGSSIVDIVSGQRGPGRRGEPRPGARRAGRGLAPGPRPGGALRDMRTRPVLG